MRTHSGWWVSGTQAYTCVPPQTSSISNTSRFYFLPIARYSLHSPPLPISNVSTFPYIHCEWMDVCALRYRVIHSDYHFSLKTHQNQIKYSTIYLFKTLLVLVKMLLYFYLFFFLLNATSFEITRCVKLLFYLYIFWISNYEPQVTTSICWLMLFPYFVFLQPG